MPEALRTSRLLAAVPNLLSAARLALAAAFPVVSPGWRLGVVAAGGLSDWLDGLIARRYELSTFKGALLDAIADKVFVFTVLLTLTLDGQVAWWAGLLVLSRDLVVAGVAAYAAARREWSAFRRMPVRPLGRITTVAQFGLFVCLLLPWSALESLEPAVLAVTAGVSVLAAGDYFVRLLGALPGASTARG